MRGRRQEAAATGPSEAVAYTLQDVFWGIAAAAFVWILHRFSELQDSLLAIGPVRQMALWALRPTAVHKAVSSAVQQHGELEEDFDTMPYYVSDEARRLLLHAGTHVLLLREEAAQFFASGLPPLGRVLMQTGLESRRFQVATAAAVAKSLYADLLIVDDTLLAEIAAVSLGGGGSSDAKTCKAQPMTGGEGPKAQAQVVAEAETGARLLWAARANGLLPYILSFFLSGGRLTFVWEALRHACSRWDRPLVVLISSAEKVVCGSPERHAAFEAAFLDQDEGQGRAGMPVLLLAGTELVDTGAHLVDQQQGRGDAMSAGRPPRGAGGTHEDRGDDSLPALLPMAAELGLSLDDLAATPDVRQQLSDLFPVRVSMGPPPEGARGAKHRAQIALDAEEGRRIANYAALTAVASAHGLLIPIGPDTDRLCETGEKALTPSEWNKVLSWAVPMEVMIRQQMGETLPDVSSARDLVKVGPAGSGGCAPPLALPTPAAPERRTLPRASSAGSLSVSSLVNWWMDPLTTGATSTSRELLPPQEQPCALEKQLLEPPTLEVRTSALRYGLEMFQKSGGALRKRVKADNQYEKALLSEVLFPEDVGSGFGEVGALDAAKDVLREAVQLPLQHPELFSGGSVLMSPCKGVLLFGPPGTGKTMLARAAAAECGASFLVLSPSTVVSKWLGDGVKLVRAAFSLAHKLSPCCMFVDEVDALLGRRDSSTEHEAVRELKNEFMAQWDGIATASRRPSRVMVLAATNRPQDLDEAVLRRFNKRVFCDLPNTSGREEVLQAILANEPLADDVSLEVVAASTEGFTGSDLRRLAAAACMRPVREFLRENSCARGQTAKKLQAAGEAIASGCPRQMLLPPPQTMPHPLQAGEEQSGRLLAVAGSPREMKQRLLEDHNNVGCSRRAAMVRPVAAADFAEARSEVTSSVSGDSHAMTELRQWNAKFGEGDRSGYRETTLSYFM